MIIIKNLISPILRKELKLVLKENFQLNNFLSINTINRKVIYCNKSNVNKYEYLIPLLKNESYSLKSFFRYNNFVEMSIINKPINNIYQEQNNYINIIIPYTSIQNGSEYLYFLNKENNYIYKNNLLNLNKEKIIEYLNKNTKLKYLIDYKFKLFNSSAYSLLKLDDNIIYIESKDTLCKDQYIFNIILSIDNNNYNLNLNQATRFINKNEMCDLVYKYI